MSYKSQNYFYKILNKINQMLNKQLRNSVNTLLKNTNQENMLNIYSNFITKEFSMSRKKKIFHNSLKKQMRMSTVKQKNY